MDKDGKINQLGIPMVPELNKDTLFIKGNLTKTVDVMNMIPEIKSDKCTFCGKCVDYCNYNPKNNHKRYCGNN